MINLVYIGNWFFIGGFYGDEKIRIFFGGSSEANPADLEVVAEATENDN